MYILKRIIGVKYRILKMEVILPSEITKAIFQYDERYNEEYLEKMRKINAQNFARKYLHNLLEHLHNFDLNLAEIVGKTRIIDAYFCEGICGEIYRLKRLGRNDEALALEHALWFD